MRNRVHQVLLVSSLYDSFILSQDGQINELLLSDFMALNLYQAPETTRVPRAKEALKLLEEQADRFNLIITTAHVGTMHVLTFAKRVREMGIKVPIVLLSYENKEVQGLKKRKDIKYVDKIFLWQGDFRMLLAIVKFVEDQMNVEHDTSEMGVQTIILIEDNTHFYSSYLPMLYTELMKHSQSLIGEGLNTGHKILRMRARPKILLCETYEEAWEHYEAYAPCVMGVISDVEFERNGEKDSNAGATFVAEVKKRQPDMPVLLQSFRQDMDGEAEEIGAGFIRKDSPTLLKELKAFLTEQLGFGDFRFLSSQGEEVDRAKDLRMLEEKLRTIPDDSLVFHAERNHFSNWLKTRTEFALADKLKPRKVSDYPSTDALRDYLIESLRNSRRELQRELLVDFSKESFDPDSGFARIGGGSLGGKGRGLAFMHHLLNINRLGEQFKDVTVTVPPTVVLCSDVFDSFLDTNDLRDFAVQSMDEEALLQRFLDAEMPEEVYTQLGELVEMVDYPLAVRSSSLLEDSQYQPFAGVYETYMLPNNHPQASLRLQKLISTIKRIFASMYRELARRHISATPYRLEEEKMAVVIQRLIGRRHGPRYYPDISGVAKSYNYYPKEPMDAKDGVASLALGLGKLVVEGGETVRVCPKYPKHILAPSTNPEFLEHSQKQFYSLNLEAEALDEHGAPALNSHPLSIAEEDLTLHYVGSVYSHENDAMYDGLSRAGVRLVTFSPVLKLGVFPLPAILTDLLKIASEGTGGPVEVEFAANLSVPKGEAREFSVLQIRPMVLNREAESIDFNGISRNDILCESEMVLGVGQMDDIYDILYVDITEFNRAETRRVAQELERFNGTLGAEERPYLLIGVGRWGSSDPWLGIPVSWDQISGAKVIVETGFTDIKVTPSQGAHFFHNLMSYMIGYFTVNPAYGEGRIDWEWLRRQQVETEGEYIRHLRFDTPVVVKMNGSKRKGVICKPAAGKR
ncbi:histidine kinase [bacterium]|nr:histidine kinase [bacterium]